MIEPTDIDVSEYDASLFLPVGYALSAGKLGFDPDKPEEPCVFLHLDGRWSGPGGAEKFTVAIPRSGVRGVIERFLDLLDWSAQQEVSDE
jgi:hypothetical protein